MQGLQAVIGAAILICLAPVAHDGDTVKCGGKQGVRLFGIEAPETGQPGDPASKANVQKLSVGGLICRPTGTSYSRVVAQCFNAAGVDIGRAQLDGGFATEWCLYSRNYYGRCP